jgi:hypothetical protein
VKTSDADEADLEKYRQVLAALLHIVKASKAIKGLTKKGKKQLAKLKAREIAAETRLLKVKNIYRQLSEEARWRIVSGLATEQPEDKRKFLEGELRRRENILRRQRARRRGGDGE